MRYIYFIDENPTELLKLAFNAINGLDGSSAIWCTPNNIIKKYKSYDKSCHFILSFFEGKTFNYLRNLNMSVFGPQLLIDYLRSDDCLPKLDVPLFSTALKGIIVCFTAVNENTKEELSKKVSMMHGTVTKDLIVGVHVLVSSKISTRKFRVAASKGMATVLESWVNELWQLSSDTDPINGIDEKLIDKHRVPIFYNLMVCVSGLTFAEREEAKLIITKNGGEYHADLTVGKCTHLISKQANGKKYNYAERWKIQIVSWKWLTDSIEKGYAVDEDDYRLSRQAIIAGSTPNSSKQKSFDSRGTEVSMITVSNIEETYINDDDEDDHVGDSLGDDIWADCVVGFLGCAQTLVDHWAPIIDVNGGRARRPDSEATTEPVTHVVVGDCPPPLADTGDNGVYHVSIDWLAACLDAKQAVPVDEFAVTLVHAAPPMIAVPANGSWESLDQYFDSEPLNADDNEKLGLFSHWKLALADGLSSQQRELATSLVSDNGASVVSDLATATHQVCPELMSQAMKQLHVPSQPHITVFYLQCCVQRNCVLSIDDDFMFRPLITGTGPQVLAGTVLSFSGYATDERRILKLICGALGAVVQEQMARRAISSKGIRATTHLVIGKRDNKKYPSSKAWAIPAVSKHWIGACVRHGALVPPAEFPMQEPSDHDVSFTSTVADFNSSMNETRMTTNTTMVSAEPVGKEEPKATAAEPLVVLNKHIQIRNSNNSNKADVSLGDLNSPMLRIYHAGGKAADGQRRKLNIDMDMLRTPDHFRPPVYSQRQHNEPDSFTTPEMTRALKSRLALLDLQTHGHRNKYLDISLSDMVSKPASLPLHAVVVYISKSVQTVLMEQKAIIEKLGGSCNWVYDQKSVTHVICSLTESDNEPISSRNREELERALSDGKILVNSDWLNDCNSEHTRVDEALYLVNLDESMDSYCRTSNNGSRKRKADEELADLSCSQESRPGVKPKLSTDSDQSAGEVGWNYSDKSQSREHMQPPAGDETQIEEDESPAPAERVFMLCSVNKDIADTYTRFIERLGATMSASKEFCATVTHLICDKPGRNTSYLSAIAAGKWVLHSSYIDECAKADRWLDESLFEWGGPRNGEFIAGKGLSPQELSLCDAAKRLREIGGGAFLQWRVCLIDKPDRVDKFSIIIMAGGGTVVPSSPLPAVGDVTHLLVNKAACAGLPDLSAYFCYKVEFLSFFLLARNEKENKKYIKSFRISSEEMASLTGAGETKVRGARRSSRKL